MSYEVWLSYEDGELQLPFKTRAEAEFVLNGLLAFRKAERIEWALNDLEAGNTLQVG